MDSIREYSILNDTLGTINAPKLNKEISNSGYVTGFSGAPIVGDTIYIQGSSLADEASLTTLIGAHVAVTLDEYKAVRYAEIDSKTVELISVGFTYDSKQFSLSIPAQTNWNALKDDTSDFTWPMELSCMNNDTYSLAESSMIAFWNTGKDVKLGHLDSGRALNKSIFDAADEAVVDAIIDNR